ncbi:unnamed protein product [Schistosoma curassoni]|uniref:Diguanylate cyclase n=1 Tax=Schistosoma curassoni TaxID=6186 RepID=A0A183K583_9TREM|nr:unnamed protein product [Schistosoma curassoni]
MRFGSLVVLCYLLLVLLSVHWIREQLLTFSDLLVFSVDTYLHSMKEYQMGVDYSDY